jgi:predicted ATPase
MRLNHLHIKSSYKNLTDFKIDFDGISFIDVFVGKNGTGKSNLFEALIEIFRHLFEKEHFITFEYLIRYELEGKVNEILWSKEKLFLNGKETKSVAKSILPDNILIYYSGHNSKITDLVKEYEDSFRKELKEANEGDTREFIGIGKDYKSLLLAVLLLQPDGNKAKEFIKAKLGIASIGDQIKIILNRPYYAKKRGYEVDRADKQTSFWKAAGITRKFLDTLSEVKPGDAKGRSRDEGYFLREGEFTDEYILYYDITSFSERFKKSTAQELFRELDNLKTIEMLHDISMDITLEDGSEATINHFSDGQFQSVYIYSIIELFKDRNCLTLLDEPDSFLHPEWQYQFLKQVFEITDKAVLNNHILMSSHSAVTLVPHNQKNIKLFHFVEKKLTCHTVNKSYAINQLSSKLLRYSEDEQILSIIHSINLEKKPVFFTEGGTDAIILKEAWQRLYKEPMPFIPVYAFNCIYLRSLLQDERIFNELGKKPMFGLFDFDEAYNEWNYLKGDKKEIESDPYKGLIVEVSEDKSYALMLPVPEIPEIEALVIKDKKKKETFLHESRMTIEHLFFADKQTHQYFDTESKPGGGFVLTFKTKSKAGFSEKMIPKLDSKHFEVFRPIFEFVKSKC